MNRCRSTIALALFLALASAPAVRAGAPQPDTRQGNFVHVCQGGPNKGDSCTIPTEDTDCPRSSCVLTTLGKPIRGTLTLIAHDAVTDWLNGGATNQAMTVLLEVRAPDGSKQMLAATYQDLATPTNPPSATSDVISIGLDETALHNLAAGGASGLLFVQPESTLRTQLQTLFQSTGTPVLVATADRSARVADHVGDGLATVLRFKVIVRFLEPKV